MTTVPRIEKNKLEKVIGAIQNFISPLNTLYLFPLVLSAVLDFFSPFGNYLMVLAIMSLALIIVSFIAYKRKVPKWVSLALVVFCVFASFVLCSSATANFSYKDRGGFLANHIPKIKTWQDAYLLDIKKDTQDILVKTTSMDKKLDQNNFLLSQLIASMQAPLEKVLQDEVKSYSKLVRNQKDALIYFSSKVGTNGIKKYKKLLAAVDQYANNPSERNKKIIMDRTRYIVSINGKQIEDDKTKMHVLALFFEPQTFNYLLANNSVVQPEPNSQILRMFNIDPALPAAQQIKDPLGDFIRELKDQNYVEVVIIPQDEKVASRKQKNGNGVFSYGI